MTFYPEFLRRWHPDDEGFACPQPITCRFPHCRVLQCSGCGSRQTIEQIRAEHPQALSCCPERKMLPTCAFNPAR